MTDEIFRDGFCDDIFRSMKMQMEPSDDVVGSLLAKIAAEAPSSVTETDNVIPFRPAERLETVGSAVTAAEVESAPRKHFAKKKTNKSIWYYGTAVAASIIVMISTFALLGNEDDASGVKDLFDQAVGSDTQIVTEDNSGNETQAPEGTNEVTAPVQDENNGSQEEENNEVQNTDSETDGQNSKGEAVSGDGKKEDSTSVQKPEPDTASGTQNGTGSDSKPSGGDKTTSSEGAQNTADNGKVTPGSAGTAGIPWTNEIIGTSQVASISVSGGNYVVENTISSSEVGETLETVTIELPQTSTTNAAEVTAKVRAMRGVSSAAMVALEVEGFDQPLVYANADYAPSSLGQFVSDLNLEKKATFASTVRCQISKVGYSANHSYTMDVHSAAWTYILNQNSAERAAYSNFTNGNTKVLFTSDSNPTGSAIQFGVSDNGYLYVNMLGMKHTFHIGTESAKGFIEYVTGEPLE